MSTSKTQKKKKVIFISETDKSRMDAGDSSFFEGYTDIVNSISKLLSLIKSRKVKSVTILNLKDLGREVYKVLDAVKYYKVEWEDLYYQGLMLESKVQEAYFYTIESTKYIIGCHQTPNSRLRQLPDGYIRVYNDDGEVSIGIDEERSPIIKYIFEAHDSGMKTCNIIAELNSQGYKSSRGKILTHGTINSVLKRRSLYEGNIEREGFFFPALL